MHLRFFDDAGSGWLWAGDDAALERFGFGPIDSSVPGLSDETRAMAEALSLRHWESINQDYPPDGCQWPQPDRDAFNRQVESLFQQMRAELGPDVELLDHRQEM